MAKYWLYMKEDRRIGAEILDFPTYTFQRRSCYSGEPLKYLVVPGSIKGEVRELSDSQVSSLTSEVKSMFINAHPFRVGVFSISKNSDGEPVGKLLTILPLATAHERGYLQINSPDPVETIC